MQGLWSEHFSAAEKPASPLGRCERRLICPKCNATSCRLLTSNTAKNPGRQFYVCPARDHKFFKWADEVKPNELIDVPYCGGCGAGVCQVRREKSGPNAGRILFMCTVKEGQGSCGYRVWQDELEMSAKGQVDERISPSQSSIINCDDTSTTNTNFVKERRQSDERPDPLSPVIDKAGNTNNLKCQEDSRNESPRRPPKMYINHLQGEGSSGYRVWQDEHEMSAMGQADERISPTQRSIINCDDTSSTTTVFVKEKKQNDERPDPLLPVINKSWKKDQLKCQQDKPNESPRRPPKRSRHGDVKGSGSLISARSLKLHLAKNTVPIEQCWIVDAIRQNLTTQLRGWWGRLAFHPMPCLMTIASKQSTYYFSSPLDSIFVVQDQILVDTNDSSTKTRNFHEVESYSKPPFNLEQCDKALDNKILANSIDRTTTTRSLLGAASDSKPLLTSDHCHDAKFSGIAPSCVDLDVPSCNYPSRETRFHQNVMSISISNAFGQAAELLQNDLLTLLETMDVKDHEAMSQAAETTFSALDRLLFDHQDFKKRVQELICCASLVADIERSMPTNDSYQRLVEQYSSERMRLDEINCVHTKVIDAVTNNKNRVRVLQEEISSTIDWLFQIEAEVSCCAVEMRNMEHDLEKISRDKEVLEGKYLIASKGLEESQKLLEQKESERNATKAAFDRARALLRG